MLNNCPVCYSNQLQSVFENEAVPQYNLNYCDTLEEALNYPKCQVHFKKCLKCHFLFNSIYEQLKYDVFYDANRSYSSVFLRFLDYVSAFLEQNFLIDEKINTVLEIGAGDCFFANKFIDEHNPKVFYAYDTAWNNSTDEDVLKRRANLYSKAENLKPDLVILRHTLEHQSDVNMFIKDITSEKPKMVYIEVPCSSFVMENQNYHFFSNEHCSYFDIESLRMLMRKHGYKCKAYSYGFNGENLLGLFTLGEDHDVIREWSDIEAGNFKSKFIEWKSNFKSILQKGDAIWGAAGKGVMFTNLLELYHTEFPIVIDINENINGKYIPITGNKVIHPDSTDFSTIKRVFVSNVLYLNEIRAIVQSKNANIVVKPLDLDLIEKSNTTNNLKN